MQFEDIINYLDSLIGQELNSLNPKTGPIVITKVDRNSKKYWVKADGSNKSVSRTFRELEEILFEMTRQGFANVDQALYGGGSSRNQPETVFAHLPYVQHFKYKNKKHLLLRDHEVHDLGELNEPTGAKLRELRKRIENYMSLSNAKVAATHSNLSSSLRQTLDAIFNKFPGDADVTTAEQCLNKLDSLGQEINEAIVSLDDFIPEIDEQEIREDEYLTLDELIDDEAFTGIENQVIETGEGVTSKPRIRQLTPTLSLIFDRLTYNEIELQPDFQRKDRIWKLDKKSKLIESILMGLPLPVFYFGEKENGDWVVVDGLQRITSVFDFMSGKFELAHLETLTQYNNKSFRALDRLDQRKIREYPIISHLIDIKSDSENIIVELFHRINTYGIKLSDQEIRSALNQGSCVTFLRYIAGLKEFKVSTGYKVMPDRQKDMELCLSAIAFIVLGYRDFDYSKFDTFLSAAMKTLNKYSLEMSSEGSFDEGSKVMTSNCATIYVDLATKVIGALALAHKIFGDFAFKKEPAFERKMPISKPLFELIVAVFSSLNDLQRKTLEGKRGAFLELFYEAIAQDSDDHATWISNRYKDEGRGFQYAISTSTGKKVTIVYRFEAFINILKQSTGIELEFKPMQLEQTQ